MCHFVALCKDLPSGCGPSRGSKEITGESPPRLEKTARHDKLTICNQNSAYRETDMDHLDGSGISYWNEVRRKLIHLSSLWMPLAMCFLPRIPLCIVFGVMLVLNLLLEHAYASGIPSLVRVYDFFFGGMLRKKPEKGQWIISGGPYVFASACLTLILFPGKWESPLLPQTRTACSGQLSRLPPLSPQVRSMRPVS